MTEENRVRIIIEATNGEIKTIEFNRALLEQWNIFLSSIEQGHWADFEIRPGGVTGLYKIRIVDGW